MNKKVNLKLRDLLEEHGMTQKELATKADVRENTISDLLKDNKQGIRFETLAKIASVTQMSFLKSLMKEVVIELWKNLILQKGITKKKCWS